MSTPDAPVPPLTIHLSARSSYMGTPDGLLGVGFWPRAAARIIDLVAHFSVTTATGFVFG